ncbi:TrbI F-type domain-containing protein [uncultured Shewanella sp.]|uniref:TrbI F-type domain-containing protein n=1 Tax=uncultured Shewanella sp. TaxID=173975 RepID=UPI0026346BA7|nr:TrbI F-type domain-containing protein [uncultured Shewanella sp.]
MNTSTFHLTTLLLFLFALLVSITVSLCTQFLFHAEIVEFDINGTITTFKQNLSQSQLSDEKRISEIKRFTQTLDKTVTQYAIEHHVVVVSDAVVSGAPNVTQEIQKQLFDNLKALNNHNQLREPHEKY